MKTRAAVAFEAKQPLEIVELDLEGPKAGEVLVEIMATGICHTDAYTLDGLDSEGLFPSILEHERTGIVREVGTVARGRFVDRHPLLGSTKPRRVGTVGKLRSSSLERRRICGMRYPAGSARIARHRNSPGRSTRRSACRTGCAQTR